MPHKLKVQR